MTRFHYLEQDRALTRRLSSEGATWLGDVVFGLTIAALVIGLPALAHWAVTH